MLWISLRNDKNCNKSECSTRLRLSRSDNIFFINILFTKFYPYQFATMKSQAPATTLPSQHDKNERKMTFHHYHQICPKN